MEIINNDCWWSSISSSWRSLGSDSTNWRWRSYCSNWRGWWVIFLENNWCWPWNCSLSVIRAWRAPRRGNIIVLSTEKRPKSPFQIDIRDLNLTYMNDVDQQVAESRALAIHMYSFFTNIIHRPWDRFSDGKWISFQTGRPLFLFRTVHFWPKFLASETEFEPILRRRLNLFGLDCDDSLRHLMFRNDRELYFFNHMLQQLYQLHDILQKIPQEDEKIFVSYFHETIMVSAVRNPNHN